MLFLCFFHSNVSFQVQVKHHSKLLANLLRHFVAWCAIGAAGSHLNYEAHVAL